MIFSRVTPRRIILTWLAILIIAAIGVVAGLPQAGQAEKISLVLSLAAASGSWAAVPLFFVGLRHFEHRARRAFILVCAGGVLYGIGTVQFPIINIVGGEDFWVGSGAALVPFVLAVSLQYFGVRRFGRLMLIKSPWLMWPLVYTGACIFAPMVALLPDSQPIMIAQAWLLTIVMSTTFAWVTIRARIASRYRPALSWLVASNALAIFSAFYQVVIVLLQLPDSHWYNSSGLSAWPFVVTAFLVVRTGYEFARIEANVPVPVNKSADPVEVVLYVASLVSDPRAVDDSLDTLRMITASPGYPNTALDANQEAALAETYKKIEDHLADGDPVLRFDAATLRESVSARFDIQNTVDSPFWRLFQNSSYRV